MTTNGKAAVLVTANGSTAQEVGTTIERLELWAASGAIFGAETELAQYRLRATVPGYYQVVVNMTFQGEAGIGYTVTVYKNGVATVYKAGHEADSASVDYNMSVAAGLFMNKDDYVEVWIEADEDAKDFTLVHGQFALLSF